MNDASPQAVIVHEDQPQTMLAAIVTLAKDPSVDVTKLDALLKMQERMESRQAEAAFNKAMSACQANIEPVVRDTENSQTRSFYAKLEKVDAAIRPIYIRHGFSLSFDEEPGDGTNMAIACDVSHIAGHTKRYRLFAPPDTLGPKGTPVKTQLHGRGSTNTFLRRYLECNIFNVVLKNLDDDGVKGGSEPITDEECAELNRMIVETKSNLDKFLQYMGVEALPDIQKKDLVKAHNALARKRGAAP